MNVLVLVKPVPNPEHEKEIRIDKESGRLIRDDVPQVIDAESRNALEEALRLAKPSGGDQGGVAVLAMAPPQSKDKLVEALAMGADEAFLLADKAFGGADTLATSFTLAEAVKKIEAEKNGPLDLILAGTSSSDGGTAHVPVQLAEWLGRTHISNVCHIETEGGTVRAVKRSEEVMLTFEGEDPAVLAVTRDINKPRFVTAIGVIKARKKPVTIWTAEDLGIAPDHTGLAGSATKPGKLMAFEQKRAGKELGQTPEEAAAEIMRLIRKAGV